MSVRSVTPLTLLRELCDHEVRYGKSDEVKEYIRFWEAQKRGWIEEDREADKRALAIVVLLTIMVMLLFAYVRGAYF